MTEYPQLSYANAEKAYDVLTNSEEPDWVALVPDHEAHALSYQSVREAVEELVLASPGGQLKKGDPRLSTFEAELGVLLHEQIPWGRHTGDKSFWRWIAMVSARSAVLYRHQYSNPPNKDNYGIGSLTENLCFRSWIRADIACEESASRFSDERYAWAKVGDQDLWRSFLIRVRYSYAREMAKALLEFQHPGRIAARTLKAGDKSTGIRMLSKKLSRLHPNMCLAALNKDECLELISELAVGLETEDGGKFTHAGRN